MEQCPGPETVATLITTPSLATSLPHPPPPPPPISDWREGGSLMRETSWSTVSQSVMTTSLWLTLTWPAGSWASLEPCPSPRSPGMGGHPQSSPWTKCDVTGQRNDCWTADTPRYHVSLSHCLTLSYNTGVRLFFIEIFFIFLQRDDCGAGEAAGVVCDTLGGGQNIPTRHSNYTYSYTTTTTTPSGPVDNCTLRGRVCLRGGGDHYGNVFIGLGRGISKPVCDDSWDTRDGIVVCRELGYHGIVKVRLTISFNLLRFSVL